MIFRQSQHQWFSAYPFDGKPLLLDGERQKADVDSAFPQRLNLLIGIQTSQYKANIRIAGGKRTKNIHDGSEEAAVRRSDCRHCQLSNLTSTRTNRHVHRMFRVRDDLAGFPYKGLPGFREMYLTVGPSK